MSILDLLGPAIIDIETTAVQLENGYSSTFKYHVNFDDSLAHTSLEALTYQGIPKKGDSYPDPNFAIYAQAPKAANFSNLRDYFIVTVDFKPRPPDNIQSQEQNPLTARTEVTWQSNLVDQFIDVDADGKLIAATNGQIIGETVPLPLFEGTAVWNQRVFRQERFDGKIGKVNSKGFKMGNKYFPPGTFMPLGVSDANAQYVDTNGRTVFYSIVTLPFSYKPTGFGVIKRNRGTYFLNAEKEPYYPRRGNVIIRDVEWDLKEDGSPFKKNGKIVPTAEDAGEEPIYLPFNPIAKVVMDFIGAS